MALVGQIMHHPFSESVELVIFRSIWVFKISMCLVVDILHIQNQEFIDSLLMYATTHVTVVLSRF